MKRNCGFHHTRRLLAGLTLLGSLAWMGCHQETVTPSPQALSTSQVSAVRELPFVQGYSSGCEQARETGKPMLVFFTAQWCTYCHQLERETLTRPEVLELGERFVCVKVDADEEQEICRAFRINGYPTILFLSPQGVPLNRLVGKKSAETLMTQMHAALQAVARRVERFDHRTTW